MVSIQIFSFLFVDVNIHLGNDETNKVAPETIPSTARVIQVSEMPSPIHRLSKKLDQLTVYVNEVLIFFYFLFSLVSLSSLFSIIMSMIKYDWFAKQHENYFQISSFSLFFISNKDKTH